MRYNYDRVRGSHVLPGILREEMPELLLILELTASDSLTMEAMSSMMNCKRKFSSLLHRSR